MQNKRSRWVGPRLRCNQSTVDRDSTCYWMCVLQQASKKRIFLQDTKSRLWNPCKQQIVKKCLIISFCLIKWFRLQIDKNIEAKQHKLQWINSSECFLYEKWHLSLFRCTPVQRVILEVCGAVYQSSNYSKVSCYYLSSNVQ